jgi:hypothetical protein
MAVICARQLEERELAARAEGAVGEREIDRRRADDAQGARCIARLIHCCCCSRSGRGELCLRRLLRALIGADRCGAGRAWH